MPPARTKDRLLDAATTVVHRDGAQALTLDAVAAEAEVSKGGLLYHFKSKRELVEGMVERWLSEFQREIDEMDAHFVRGYVKAGAPEGSELGMLALVLRDLPIGLTYAVWAAVGTALIAAIGIVAFGEPATTLKLLSLALIIAGTIGLNLAGSH